MNKLDIINSCLRKVGARQVVSETEEYPPLKLAMSAYDFVLQDVLREFAWSFATVYKEFAKSASSPDFGYKNAFQIPLDVILILDARCTLSLQDKEIEFEKSGNTLLCDNENMYVRYITNKINYDVMPVDFANCFATKLASEIALNASQQAGMQMQLLQVYEVLLDKAKLNDMRENNAIQVNERHNSKLLNSRL